MPCIEFQHVYYFSAHFLTFWVYTMFGNYLQCCSPDLEIAIKPCTWIHNISTVLLSIEKCCHMFTFDHFSDVHHHYHPSAARIHCWTYPVSCPCLYVISICYPYAITRLEEEVDHFNYCKIIAKYYLIFCIGNVLCTIHTNINRYEFRLWWD